MFKLLRRTVENEHEKMLDEGAHSTNQSSKSKWFSSTVPFFDPIMSIEERDCTGGQWNHFHAFVSFW